MIEAQHNSSNVAALKRVGISLLPGEHLDAAVDLEGGLTDELEASRTTLLLTNRRLIRYVAGGHRIDTISVALDDVQAVVVKRGDRNRQVA